MDRSELTRNVAGRKIIVLGSNAFSATHFIDHALEAGAQVWGLSRSEEQESIFAAYKSNKNLSKFTFCQLDLNNNMDSIKTLTGDVRPDYVVNFAAQSMVAQSWDNPEHWYETNIMANLRLHEYLRKCDFLKKYVHVSTPEVYGSCKGNIKENTPFNPSTPYAVSRAACDLSLAAMQKHYNFPVVFTRAANVYGSGQQLYRIVPKTIITALTGQRLPLEGGGLSTRSFIHAKDVAVGTLGAMVSGSPGDCFHLSTDRFISIKDLVALICNEIGVDMRDCVDIAPERPGKDAAYILSSEHASKKLQWEARVSLEDGVSETISWVKENLETLKFRPQVYIHKK